MNESKPTEKALALGNEIKQILVGTPLEKDAMILGAMYSSGYFKDLTSLSKAITKAMIGHELGMGVVQSLNSLYVIDGKVAMDSHAVRNTAVAAGYSIKTLQSDYERCVLEWSYNNEVLGTSEFTMEDAKKAGLAQKSNWLKYPKAMLFARAITAGARMHANQAFAGNAVYTQEELEDTGEADFSPDDERVVAIREANDLETLKNITIALTVDERKALASVIAARVREIKNA